MKAKATPICDDCSANAFRFHGGRWLCPACYDRAREQDALTEVARDRARAIVEAEQLRREVASQ